MNTENAETGVNNVRLNKYLSEAGACSRREADRMVENGRITVNGVTAVMGMKVSENDVICIDEKPIYHKEPPVLLIYNKPLGVVCSTREKDNIIDYIGYHKRIYPIGRLDKNSEGLILLTNQGDISDAVLRAANFHEKEYLVKVNKPINDEFVNGMQQGVPILDTVTRPCTIKVMSPREFTIIITQGLNRQIRRMCEYFDYRVVSLKRIRIMNITLGNLRTGQYREMSLNEIEDFRRLICQKKM